VRCSPQQGATDIFVFDESKKRRSLGIFRIVLDSNEKIPDTAADPFFRASLISNFALYRSEVVSWRFNRYHCSF
jgi:hypothetical protein